MTSPRPIHGDEEIKLGSGSLKGMTIEGEEMVSLLEDSRTERETHDEESGSNSGRSSSVKRMSIKEREKMEKRNRRGSSVPDSWNLRENFLWLWGGSQYSGVLCMVAASLSYSLMGLLIRLVTVHEIPSFETIAIRCAVVAAISGLALKKMDHPLLGTANTNLKILLSARAIVGFSALASFFYSIQVLPLRDADMLSFAAPVFTALIASIFIDEKFGTREITGTAFCVLGVLMIAQPPLIFGGPKQATGGGGGGGRHETVVGVLVGLLSAIAGAVTCCLIRSVGKTGENPLVVVFVFSAFSSPAALISMLLFQKFVLPGVAELIGMIIVGGVACVAEAFMSRALQLDRAAKVTSMQYLKLVATYILGVLFLNESISLKGIAGVLLICGASIFVALGEKDRAEDRA